MSDKIMPDTTDPRVGTTFQVDGWTVTVASKPFDGTTPFDADCYTAAGIAAWKVGEWWYCGCIVTVGREGIDLGDAALWGIEEGLYTYTDEDDNVTGHGYVGPYTEAVDDLIAEAIDNAKALLAKLGVTP